MKRPLAASIITSVLIGAAVFAVPPAPGSARPNAASIPVLLELFTSEGCSSCPPADRLLESLDHQPVAGADLIVLSEHVDYWNYLGWSDPFSSPAFSSRQQKYSERLGTDVYTPQLVVDGQFQATGSDQREVMQAIAKAVATARLPVAVHAIRSGSGASVHVDANTSGQKADLYIAIAADHARSQVLRGENGGKALSHVAVAQGILKIGKWDGSDAAGKDLSLTSQQLYGTRVPSPEGQTRIIAIMQDPVSGRILGVAQTRI